MTSLTPATRTETPLPRFIDEIAEIEPQRIQCSIPIDDNDLSKGFRDINFAQTARAINRLCEIVEKAIGRNQSSEASNVCYIGVADPRCHWVTIALLKLGHCALMSAPRNSQVMHHNLFDENGCKTLLHVQGIDATAVIGDREMTAVMVPSIVELLAEGAKPRKYPYDRSWDEIKEQPLVIVHTSGSTGMSKAIAITHAYPARMADWCSIPEYKGRQNFGSEWCDRPGKRRYVAFPPFHAGGLLHSSFPFSYYGNTVHVFGPSVLPPLGPVVKDVIKYGNICSMLAIPAALMQLAKDPESLKLIEENVNRIFYAGGSLDDETGNAISRVTNLQCAIGSTECSLQGLQLIYKPEERNMWKYCFFAPDQGGVEWEERDSGIFEQVLKRDATSEHLHCVWTTFPQATEYRTKDTFRCHPDPEWSHVLKFESRIDDLITFSNASKYNPIAYENAMVANPLVRSALMFGTLRPFAGLLIELSNPSSEADRAQRTPELVEQIWTTVDTINRDAPKHAQVRKDMILFAMGERPFERATKGTAIRKRTLALYEAEIEALYEAST